MLVIMMKLLELAGEQILRLMKNTNVFERSLLWAAFQWTLVIVAIAVTGESEVTTLSLFLFAMIGYNQVKSAWYEYQWDSRKDQIAASRALALKVASNAVMAKQEEEEKERLRKFGVADWEM